ncbi:MAG: linear amide C-N hydrolase [Fimbriimonadaceae bacterium]|nr:linear amide C-N hydrolase [Fimbriimonadaceae bacterium]
MTNLNRLSINALAALGIGVSGASVAEACTRIVYKGQDNLVVTGRSMDFKDDIPANLWALPRGMERNGQVGPSSVTWKSKYGSVVAESFGIATTDGVNEKGLAANMLWLVPTKYPEFDGTQRALAVSVWLQYVLDNFANVKEVVEALSREEFFVVSSVIPGTDKFVTVHLSVSDSSGDNAIFEYVDGRLVVHHSPDYTVMTNEPVFEDQLAISRYWASVDGTAMLPGTSRAADRFARASFYLKSIPQTGDERLAVAKTLSIIRNCSVPYGITTQFPNISTTQWRTVTDHKNLRYFFESATSPNLIWVDLKKLDFAAGNPAKKLTLGPTFDFVGDSTGHLKPATMFEFAGLP